ncbi:hypothetical protein FGO68_gene15274 [Halteria grandinella]|uniref:Transmembrane protein n=1 Tax=Halteria grandinella TaxID=5974 RepID=A0A8J8NQ34_HALGN|nr:hypothetical protein FGO68_gene15274 [Halteria grandinella]
MQLISSALVLLIGAASGSYQASEPEEDYIKLEIIGQERGFTQIQIGNYQTSAYDLNQLPTPLINFDKMIIANKNITFGSALDYDVDKSTTFSIQKPEIHTLNTSFIDFTNYGETSINGTMIKEFTCLRKVRETCKPKQTRYLEFFLAWSSDPPIRVDDIFRSSVIGLSPSQSSNALSFLDQVVSQHETYQRQSISFIQKNDLYTLYLSYFNLAIPASQTFALQKLKTDKFGSVMYGIYAKSLFINETKIINQSLFVTFEPALTKSSLFFKSKTQYDEVVKVLLAIMNKNETLINTWERDGGCKGCKYTLFSASHSWTDSADILDYTNMNLTFDKFSLMMPLKGYIGYLTLNVAYYPNLPSTVPDVFLAVNRLQTGSRGFEFHIDFDRNILAMDSYYIDPRDGSWPPVDPPPPPPEPPVPPTPPTPIPDDESEKQKQLIIILSICGGSALLVVVLIIGCCCARKRKQRLTRERNESLNSLQVPSLDHNGINQSYENNGLIRDQNTTY